MNYISNSNIIEKSHPPDNTENAVRVPMNAPVYVPAPAPFAAIFARGNPRVSFDFSNKLPYPAADPSFASASSVSPPKSYRYTDAGVSIAAGNALVKAIAPLAKSTRRAGCDAGLGGFGGFFDLKASGWKDPLLVAANDGVGTKLKLAIAGNRHDTVGIDLVAMCVNDLLVQGAEPLFFLDYYASGKLTIATAERVIAGIATGCIQAGCALIGGETAEMPDLYATDDYDLAGFAVGAVERDSIPGADKVAAGDVILGMSASGLHSNGFSLVRRLAADKGWRLDRAAPFDGTVSLIEALLEPTRIYVRAVLPLVRAGRIHALAHITGGGLLENIPRVLPKGLVATLTADSWELPPIVRFVQNEGAIAPQEMARTFNCGIGMVLIVAPQEVAAVTAYLTSAGEQIQPIGEIGEIGALGALAPMSDELAGVNAGTGRSGGRSGCVITGTAGLWGEALGGTHTKAGASGAWLASYFT